MKRSTNFPRFRKQNNELDGYGIFKGTIGVFALLIVLMVGIISGIMYYSKVYVYKSFGDSLKHSQSQITMALNQGVDYLQGLSEMISNLDDISSADVLNKLLSKRDKTLFSNLGLRFADGVEFIENKGFINGVEQEDKTNMTDNESSASIGKRTISVIDGSPIVRIFVPVKKGDVVEGNVYGIMETERLSQTFYYSGFDGACDIIIFEATTGDVIMNNGNNLPLTNMKIGEIGRMGKSSASFFKDVGNGKSGMVTLSTTTGNVVCAYAPFGISDWYIMHTISEKNLFDNLNKNSLRVFLIFVLCVAIMFVFVVWMYRRVEKVKNDTDSVAYQVNMRDRILSTALADTSMRVFLYYRGKNKLSVMKDATGLRQNEVFVENGLNYIADYEQLDADDTRRLRNSFALTGANGNIKLTVKSNRTNPPTFLKYTFSSVKDAGGDDDVIICTALDDTESFLHNKQKLDLETFRNTVVSYKTTGIELFLESNRWRCMWNNEPVFQQKIQTMDLRNNYDQDLKKIILPEIRSSEKQIFEKHMNRLSLLEMFRSGKNEISFDYCIKTGKAFPDDYEIRIMDIHLLRDKLTDEVKADVYIRNVDKEEVRKASPDSDPKEKKRVLALLSGYLYANYTFIAMVDLNNNAVTVVCSDGVAVTDKPMQQNFESFVSNFAKQVHPEDKELYLSAVDAKNLEQTLNEKNVLNISYRKKSSQNKDGYIKVNLNVASLPGGNDGEVVFTESQA